MIENNHVKWDKHLAEAWKIIDYVDYLELKGTRLMEIYRTRLPLAEYQKTVFVVDGVYSSSEIRIDSTWTCRLVNNTYAVLENNDNDCFTVVKLSTIPTGNHRWIRVDKNADVVPQYEMPRLGN